MLFARRASPCSRLPILPGAASAVLASSPCEACCFRFVVKIPTNSDLRPTLTASENRKQNRISLHRAETRERSAVGSDGSFIIAAFTRKNVLFAHSTSPLGRVLASQGTDHNKLDNVCSTKLRVLAAKFEGRRWSVSRGLAWDVRA